MLYPLSYGGSALQPLNSTVATPAGRDQGGALGRSRRRGRSGQAPYLGPRHPHVDGSLSTP
jgi:hypothetical protein